MGLESKKNTTAWYLAVGTMMVAALCWFTLFSTDTLRGLIPKTLNQNFLFYVIFLVIGLAAFFVPGLLFRKLLARIPEENRKRENCFFILFFLLLLAGLQSIFYYESAMPYAYTVTMPWHTNQNIEILVSISFVLTAIAVVKYQAVIKTGGYKVPLFLFYLILALFAGHSVYQPNIFNDWYDTVHFNAYFTSVYRVLHLEPFTEVNCGAYGFYGILLAPLTALFGGSIESCMLALAVLTATSVLCFCYVLEELVQSTWLRIFGGIGIVAGIVGINSEIRVQRFPHRFIFVGFTIAFLTWFYKHAKRKTVWLGVVFGLTVLALLWNLETGAACLLAFVGSSIVSLLQKHVLKQSMFWIKMIKKLLLIPSALFAAFLLVGIYNLIVSGQFISLKAFAFPFIGGNLIEGVYLELPTYPGPYLVPLLLFLLAAAVVIKGTCLWGIGEEDAAKCILAAGTIAAVVQTVYYINRPDSSYLYVIFPLSSIILAYLADLSYKGKAWNEYFFGSGTARAFCAVAVTYLLFGALGTISIFFSIEEKRNTNRYMENIYEFARLLEEELPADTEGFGIGVPEIYSLLNRDTYWHGVDMAEFRYCSEEIKMQICQHLNESGNIFINDKTIDQWLMPYIEENEIALFYTNHTLAAVYEYNGMTFSYYIKK